MDRDVAPARGVARAGARVRHARAAAPSDGARIAFYEGLVTAAGVRIAPIDAPAAGLAAGDRVERGGDRSMEAWAGLLLDPSVPRPAGGPIRYARGARRRGAADRRHLGGAGDRRDAARGLERRRLLDRVRRGRGVRLRPAPRRASRHGPGHRRLRGRRQQRAVVPRRDVERPRAGAVFLLHAALTGGLYMLLWPAAVHLAPSSRGRCRSSDAIRV